jgi:hypothetical protein
MYSRMTVLLVLLLLLFLLIILKLFTATLNEGFQTQELDSDVLKEYDTFLTFYTTFCTNWQKAIISSVAADIPQQPSTSVTSASAPQITESEMNMYITKLSQQTGKSFPQICISLPGQIDASSLPSLLQKIPQSSEPYMNALNWMNDKLSSAHSDLDKSLQGYKTEGFEDTCQNMSQCIANNPQLAQQIAQQIAQQNTQSINEQQQQLLTILKSFNDNQQLLDANQTNNTLIQKSQDIQNQAQSGELFKQINIPDTSSITKYSMPDGGNALGQMQQSDPQKYNEYKNNYSQWFSMKQLMEQINSNLQK